MKFATGPTWSERHSEKLKWHRWFAWHPVRVGSREKRWLEYVERKGTVWEATSIWGYTWEYRSIQ